MCKSKKTFVKQQHYIPKFVLENFKGKDEKILFVDISQHPLKTIRSCPGKLMREKDFYEIKDDSGNYILRNYIEDTYSHIEGDIKPNFQELIDLSKRDDFQDQFVEITQSHRWVNIEFSLLVYLITTLIRSKEVKKLVNSNSNLTDKEKHIMYLLFTTSKVNTVKYAEKMYSGQDLENILYFIENVQEEPLKNLTEYIMNNYQIRVHKSLGNKKFLLSDNPVIVQKFEEEDYHLPISPEICIGLTPIMVKGNEVFIDSTLYHISDENVERINEQFVLNTDRLIIISDENDLKFISNIVSEVNTK